MALTTASSPRPDADVMSPTAFLAVFRAQPIQRIALAKQGRDVPGADAKRSLRVTATLGRSPPGDQAGQVPSRPGPRTAQRIALRRADTISRSEPPDVGPKHWSVR